MELNLHSRNNGYRKKFENLCTDVEQMIRVLSVSRLFFENVRETEEKKQLLKRKREQGKRWFTKPERLDRRNENGAKLQQDPRFFFFHRWNIPGCQARSATSHLNLASPCSGRLRTYIPRWLAPLISREKKPSQQKRKENAQTSSQQGPDEDGTKTRQRPVFKYWCPGMSLENRNDFIISAFSTLWGPRCPLSSFSLLLREKVKRN